MIWSPSRKLRVYLVLVACGVVAGLAMGRPEPVILVVPLAVAIGAGLAMTTRPDLSLRAAIDRELAFEGEMVCVTVDVDATSDLPSLELALLLPSGVASEHCYLGATMPAGSSRTFEIPLDGERWGRYELRHVLARVTAPLGLLVAVGTSEVDLGLEVRPPMQLLRRLVRPKAPRAVAGSQLARVKDVGVEFADIRPFTTGDRARDVNWRASARRAELWVNERHPDRSTDVVLLLDTFSELAVGDVVRAANAFAHAYLEFRDRVGLVTFGGFVHWLRPGTGRRQEQRIVDMLLETTVFTSEIERSVDQIPTRMLPPKALVLAISSLFDDQSLRVLVDLRSRGFDLVVVQVSPRVDMPTRPTRAAVVGRRLWDLRREATRDRLRELGIPVAEWQDGEPLAQVVEEVAAWPRAGVG